MPALSRITPVHRTSADAPAAVLQPSRKPPIRALDCGAGVGRVTETVLAHLCDIIDLVEPAAHFLGVAHKAAPSWRGVSEGQTAVRLFRRGLQDYDPRDPISQGGEPPMVVGPYDELLAASDDVGEGRYDVIMIQVRPWCIGHLSDAQFVAFLKKCRAALRPDDPAQPDRRSVIVVKENCSSEEVDNFDEADSSTTRCDTTFRKCFAKAGLTIERTELQLGFPDELLPVRSYALR